MSLEFYNHKIQQQIDASRERARQHGWPFNERTPADHNFGDLISAVCSIDSAEDVARFYAGYIEFIQEWMNSGVWKSKCTAEEGARANIGWCYGEGMPSERIAMWRRATGAEHPFLPSIETLSGEEIFQAGIEQGRKG